MNQLCNKQISERLKAIQNNIYEAAVKANRNVNDIQIMAVTKTVSPEIVNISIDNGIELLGENRVQEFLDKKDAYKLKKQGIHFIGHLQTNKVKYIIDKVSMIESVSSLKLAKEIDLRAGKHNIKMNVLLEINMANEATKHGFLIDELEEAMAQITKLPNLTVRGMMCIPPKQNSDFYFEKMNHMFMDFKVNKYHDFSCLSMGMSDDYQKAIKHNSTIVRLGSAIFGQRNNGG